MTALVRLIGAAALFLAMTAAATAYPATVASDLNMRAGPGVNYRVILVLPRGANVEVLSCSGNWCRIAYANRLGYASQRYLVPQQVRPPRAGPPPVFGPPPVLRPSPRRPSPRVICNERHALWAIGEFAGSRTVERARVAANARIVRVIRPGGFYTQDFQRDRLNIEVNRRNIIINLHCG